MPVASYGASTEDCMGTGLFAVSQSFQRFNMQASLCLLFMQEPLMLSACSYSNMEWRRSAVACSRTQAALKAKLHRYLLKAALLFNACMRVQSDAKSLLALSDSHAQKVCLPSACTPLHSAACDPAGHSPFESIANEPASSKPDR